MATRIVQTILRRPEDGSPICNRTVSVSLNSLAFDGSHGQILGTSYPISAASDAGVPGLVSLVLDVNADIPRPSATSYSMDVPGSVLTFVVPAGDPAVPVWIDDILVPYPTNPNPIVIDISLVANIDGGNPGSIYSPGQRIDCGGPA